ncbi:ATP-dependent Clp protease adaptor ClpS [Oceanidesulfovibrio indonesiensis]|uniref:ATP-dependent Clp protease adapter protein ClpS n=1 Tax=Oceanidesulfovibrio indonesiensis TaxID=54767 RepID=A0A7M3MHC1_9BACT|nr:ATP-dependent Clp protease adaptor ClpS [Oceanidesulfovibrio indonesiensis]TVM18415.1 ATP-dependent Clp protease adaptor ClpS [Oceanidesulfovibrio indonesiensis]
MTTPYNRPEFEPEIGLEEEVGEPRKYKVLLHNDDYTTMDFVIRVLMEIFRKSETEATHIMLTIHEKGVGTCGIYPAEVAETKINEVHSRARREGFPLRASMEEV